MSTASENDTMEMLSTIFTNCDVDGSGIVDINTLINFLIFKDPRWQKDTRIEEEFRKLLCCNGSSQLISKEYFISSVLNCMKSKNYEDEEDNSDEKPSLGTEQSAEISPASRRNSRRKMFSAVYCVSDGQTLTNDDVVDESSVPDIESPPVNRQLVTALENEVNSLQRKNDYLESTNSILICQISSLEEIIAKTEKESADKSKKLLASHQLLEMHKLRQEEAEDKLNLTTEDNKSVTIQLSQSERENAKLNEFISQLETQIDGVTSEKMYQDTKIKAIKENYEILNDLFTKSQEELNCLKMKEQTRKETLEELMKENRSLQYQLKSSDAYVQDLKYELDTAHKELSNLLNGKLKASRLKSPIVPDVDTSSDNSTISLDNFTIGSIIPFERSLLAELQDKESQRSCTCDCLKNASFSTSSPVLLETHPSSQKLDVAVMTDEKSFVHKSTMATSLHGNDSSSHSKSYKDMGVNCSLKKVCDEEIVNLNCKLCHLKSKRSLTKWLTLGYILLLLCFLLGFFSSLASLSHTSKYSHRSAIRLSSLFEFFYISKKYQSIY